MEEDFLFEVFEYDEREDYHKEFFAEATIRADSGGDWMLASMFEIFEEVASENGDVEALDYTPHRSQGMKIDGYNYEPETAALQLLCVNSVIVLS